MALSSTGYTWVDVPFNADVFTNNVSSKEFVVVVKGLAGPNLHVQYLESASAPADGPKMNWTTNSGGSWDPQKRFEDGYDMPFYLYGTYTEVVTVTEPVTRHYLRTVGMSLSAGEGGNASGVDAGFAVLNEPEVSGP